MTKDEALKLALEALEDLGIKHFENTGEVLYKDTFTAIKEALAQPEQEPVAWVHHLTFKNLNSFERSRYSTTLAKKQTDACCIPLYTTPPQRKPLTENEIKHLWYEACQTNLELTSQLIVHLARNIEAAHGIKGEA